MRKTFKSHPFFIIVMTPKGHPKGFKSRECILTLRFKTIEQKDKEKGFLIDCGCTIFREGQGKEIT